MQRIKDKKQICISQKYNFCYTIIYILYENKTDKNLLKVNNSMRNINNKNKFAFS